MGAHDSEVKCGRAPDLFVLGWVYIYSGVAGRPARYVYLCFHKLTTVTGPSQGDPPVSAINLAERDKSHSCEYIEYIEYSGEPIL